MSIKAPRIIVIGATGWYGRILLHEYCATYGEDLARKNLLLASSRDCKTSIKIDGEIKSFQVYALKNILNLDLSSYQTLFWYAFVLRNQIDLIGPDVWKQKNEEIAGHIFSLLKFFPRLRVIYFSSGAALEWVSTPEYDVDPYANLKIKYEKILRATSECIVVYPYATSGSYLADIDAFALSSFINQALTDKVIQIKAGMPVVRSYGSAHDFSKILLKFSEQVNWNKVPKDIVPVTHTLELQQLACEVIAALRLDIPIIRSKLSTEESPSIYVANSFEFPILMAKWGLISTTLGDQIRGMASDTSRHEID
jgi:hypothetical protein